MQRSVESMPDSRISLHDYPNRSVWTTWNISYDSIFKQDKAAAYLLVFWSFLYRENIWYGMFERAVAQDPVIRQELSQWLGSIATKEDSFLNAMHLLRRYSLVESSSDGYVMHAVVHRWAYSYQGLKMETLGRLALIVVTHAVPEAIEREFDSLQHRLLPHAQTCANKVLGKEGANANANAWNSDLLLSWNREQEFVLHAIALLGNLYYYQSKFNEAARMYEQALRGQEKVLGVKHISTIKTVVNLGNVYKDQKKLDEAEKMYVRALQSEEELGPKHVIILQTVGSLAITYARQDKLDEAEKMFLRALKGQEEALEANHEGQGIALEVNHSAIFITMNNLGNVYKDQGKLAEAEKMLLRALQGLEKELGAKHTTTLNICRSLGLLRIEQGKLDEAEKLLVRTLQGFEEAFGPEHPSTVKVVISLGVFYNDQKKLAEAEEMFLRVVQSEVKDQEDHLKYVMILGVIYAEQDKLDEAEKMLLRVLRGCEEAVGAGFVQMHDLALNVMCCLGDLYSKTPSRIAESRDMFTKAFAGYRSIPGAPPDICLEIQSELDKLDAVAGSDTTKSGSSADSMEVNTVSRKRSGRLEGIFKRLMHRLKK